MGLYDDDDDDDDDDFLWFLQSSIKSISTKHKTPIPTKSIFNYFLTLKKYHANKYTFLSLNRIMRIYSNAYNCAIYLKLLVFLHALSIQ